MRHAFVRSAKKFHRHGRRRDERGASRRLWDVLDVLERYTAVDDKFDSSDVAAFVTRKVKLPPRPY